MNYKTLIHRILVVPALVSLFVSVGCVAEQTAYPTNHATDRGTPVTITVSIPAHRMPQVSRSIADADGESVVKTIDVLIFKPGEEGHPEVLAGHAAGKIVSQSPDPDDDYEVRFTADLAAEPAATTVVILANVPPATIASATSRSEKQDVLERLVYTSSNPPGTSDGWKWNTVDADTYTPIPMYGECPVSGIAPGERIENIALTRMLARIDVENNATGFTLKGVYVVNFNTSGYIAPAWGTGGVLKSVLPAAPMIPTGSDPHAGTPDESDAMYFPCPETALRGEIYVYEASATSGVAGDPTHTDAICLIVKGKRTNDTQDSYFRIDFTEGTDAAGKGLGESGFDPSTVGYMAVYRNRHYLFDISEVTGSGYERFDDALRSLGMMNNLKTRLHVVDQRGILYMVFNGQYCLGASRKVYNVKSGADSGYELEIFSNAGDPKATTSDSWITVGVPQHVSDEKYTLTFGVGANPETTPRTGQIYLTAGRLTLSVDVVQNGRTITRR